MSIPSKTVASYYSLYCEGNPLIAISWNFYFLTSYNLRKYEKPESAFCRRISVKTKVSFYVIYRVKKQTLLLIYKQIYHILHFHVKQFYQNITYKTHCKQWKVNINFHYFLLLFYASLNCNILKDPDLLYILFLANINRVHICLAN